MIEHSHALKLTVMESCETEVAVLDERKKKKTKLKCSAVGAIEKLSKHKSKEGKDHRQLKKS